MSKADVAQNSVQNKQNDQKGAQEKETKIITKLKHIGSASAGKNPVVFFPVRQKNSSPEPRMCQTHIEVLTEMGGDSGHLGAEVKYKKKFVLSLHTSQEGTFLALFCPR